MRKMDGRFLRPSFIAAKPRCELKHGEGIMKKLLIIASLTAVLTGCKQTEYVVVPEYHTDTLRVAQIVTDSVYKHDSIYIRQSGDTVLIEKWHTVWQNHTAHDTVYKSRVDTIAKPYPVIKEVEKPLTKTQKGLMWMGGLSLMALFVFGVYKVKRFLPGI